MTDAELFADPVFQILLSGRATTLSEAENLYLDEALPEAYALLDGPLSQEELGRHPLMVLYRNYGSRPWEDALE